ncbi:MAG: hypothetical protein AAFR73_12765 [Pseudomonadota bacterium]
MGKRAPKPTDPAKVAAAQTGSNLTTAVGNAFMQNVNEIGPDGTRTFDQTGTKTVTDPYSGKTYEIPQFTSTTTLSPEQQAIKDQQNRSGLNLATLGADLSGTLGNQLTGNFTLDNESTESRLFDLGRKRLDPMLAQQEEALRTRLANQGIKAGSEAYDREMSGFNNRQNDAYNQLLLTGRGQAVQEQLTEDNQRINQISALMSGGQVSQPMFAGQVGVGGMNGTNVAGIIGQSDAAKLNAHTANQQALGGLFDTAAGGLFGLL